VSISVVERVREIGILRSIGATRRQVLAAVVLEWAIVGFAGSVAGVALGWALARGLVAFTAKTVNMYALAVDVSRVVFAWPGAVVAVVAGTAVAAGAALLPGLEAMRITPVGLLRQGTFQYRASPRYRRSFAVGLALVAASAALLAAIPSRLPTAGLLAVSTVAFFAIALCGPQATVWIAHATRPLLRRFFRVEGYLAADNVSKFPQRTALTVVAFGGAVAMMVASASIVASFDRSGMRWLEDALPFDLTLNCADMSGSIYSPNAYEDSMVSEVQRLDGVELAYGVRSAFVPYGGTDVMLLAIEMDGYFEAHGRRGSHWTGAVDTPELRSGASVLASENFAYLRGVRAGDTIELPTPDGPRRFAVGGLVQDYSWPAGTLIIDRFAYRRIWGDDTVSYTDVRAKPGAKEQARSELAALVKGRGTFFIYEVSDLKKVARDTMDQGMALVNVQVLIAMGIGFLGIVNTLLISVLRRTREIGLLRAVGATRAQVRRTIVIEAAFIAAVGALLGVVAGLVGAAVPLRTFTLRITGFWVPFAVPWGTIALAMAASLVLGLAASWAPARRAGRMDVLDAVAYE
jgi:putative ABC transport system permease protein